MPSGPAKPSTRNTQRGWRRGDKWLDGVEYAGGCRVWTRGENAGYHNQAPTRSNAYTRKWSTVHRHHILHLSTQVIDHEVRTAMSAWAHPLTHAGCYLCGVIRAACVDVEYTVLAQHIFRVHSHRRSVRVWMAMAVPDANSNERGHTTARLPEHLGKHVHVIQCMLQPMPAAHAHVTTSAMTCEARRTHAREAPTCTRHSRFVR